MTATVKKKKKRKRGEGGLSGDFLNQMDCKSDEKWSITTTNQLYYHSYFTLFHPPAHFLKTNEANEKQNLHLKPVRNVPWSPTHTLQLTKLSQCVRFRWMLWNLFTDWMSDTSRKSLNDECFAKKKKASKRCSKDEMIKNISQIWLSKFSEC